MKPDEVGTIDSGAIAYGFGEGDYILGDDTAGADPAVVTYSAVLVHAAEGSDSGEVFYDGVSGKASGVSEYIVIADDAIMGDVRVGHEVIIVADNRCSSASLSTSMDGAEFAENVVVSDLHFCWSAGVGEVLWQVTDSTALVKSVSVANYY